RFIAQCILTLCVPCVFLEYSFCFTDESDYRTYMLKQSNGLFNNYADGTTSNGTSNNFNDASSSALLAATVYHLALLTGNKKFIPEAERTRAALFSTNDTAASA